jgi:hypothetical protein
LICWLLHGFFFDLLIANSSKKRFVVSSFRLADQRSKKQARLFHLCVNNREIKMVCRMGFMFMMMLAGLSTKAMVIIIRWLVAEIESIPKEKEKSPVSFTDSVSLLDLGIRIQAKRLL